VGPSPAAAPHHLYGEQFGLVADIAMIDGRYEKKILTAHPFDELLSLGHRRNSAEEQYQDQ
jgi:hypothetical protein